LSRCKTYVGYVYCRKHLPLCGSLFMLLMVFMDEQSSSLWESQFTFLWLAPQRYVVFADPQSHEDSVLYFLLKAYHST
jgi:hypothetical protein